MTPNRTRQLAWGTGLVAAGMLAGAVAAAALPAGAQTPSPSTGSSSGGAAAPAAPRGQHPGETLLTGTNAEKAKAAALKALPGATIDRVETDAEGAVYEAHVTKADGTRATVKFDKDFNVTAIETGRGGGGRGHDAPSGTTGTTSGTSSGGTA
ncbi:MAG: hypothetical protein QOE45_666 [Frankiaceae bacterium]|jgi:hypothetical protein|nr:hypothetical protein [Frankiaceae bacterium]